MNINVPDAQMRRAERSNRRAEWMRQLRQWHWISGAVSLVTMLLFAVTGITLNHAASIEAKPSVTTAKATLDQSSLKPLESAPTKGRSPFPAATAAGIAAATGVDVDGRDVEWSDDEAYVTLPRPGGDAWISIDRETGELTYEKTDRGWIAYLNDLHKGRNVGAAWGIFIDVFALCCVAFCVTGLLLLQMYARGRPSTWPVVGLGVVIPILIAILLIH
ncbi:PepSY-associated TM helix domain-containing protein [Hyphomicrobium sp. B1]|uniref:PepSY-associated TM helix domain-containing protein n=1 Tax=unclassified Hyphomicrobium TaxID=2619925 RepID=UPI0039C437E2